MYISRRGWVRVIGAFSSVLLVCLVSSASASATNAWVTDELKVREWSQLESEPTEQYNVSVACKQQEIQYYDPYKLREIESSACVHQAKTFSIARITLCEIINGSICRNDNWTFIALEGDNKFYKIDNLLAGTSDNCWQTSPDSMRIVFTCNGNFTIVENIFQHLDKLTYPVSGNTYFDFEQAGYSTLPLNGQILWDLRGAVVSKNMTWAVIALREIGVMRVNLDEMSVQLVTKTISRMNVGSDPLFHFALTNDGRTVAIGGNNTVPSIYHISDTCGLQSSAIEHSWYDRSEIDECDFVHTGSTLMDAAGGPSAGFRYWRYLKFSEDETRLSGLFVPYRGIPGGISGWVNIDSTKHVPVERLDYLALGDSYTSGEGDYSLTGSHGNFMPFTDVSGPPEERCHLSKRSYPYLLRDMYSIDTNSMRSVACSGAKTTDIISGKDIYHGQNDRLKNFGDEGDYKYDALNASFIPGRVEQIEFVRKYKPRVITVGIGGNDAEFAKELNLCVDFPFRACGAALEDGVDRKRVGKLIVNNYDKLRNLYRDLKKASPQTSILAVGYPKFINEDNAICLLNGAFVNASERIFINEAVEFMNEVIKAAASSEGVKYLDIEDSLLGGRLCEGISDDYVTGMRNQLWILSLLKNQRAYLYHPNATGHSKIAEHIQKYISGHLIESENPSPIETGPEGNDYFKSSSEKDKRLISKEYISTSIVRRGQTIQSKFDPGTFGNSATTVTIFSTPRTLGSQMPNIDGSLRGSVTIPADMAVGYHTLVYSGIDFAGLPVDVSQSVFVMSDDVDDIDDDRIVDSRDSCLFWISCGEEPVNPDSKHPIADATNSDTPYSLPNGDDTLAAEQINNENSRSNLLNSPAGIYAPAGTDDVLGTSNSSNIAVASDSISVVFWYASAFGILLFVTVLGLVIKYYKG